MVQYTKKAIEDTFLEMVRQQSLDKITVKDLVSRCGVNRNTFYYHYEDIYDLIEKIFEREKKRVMGQDYASFSYKEALEQVIELLLNNKDAIRNIYYSKGKDIIDRYLTELGDDFCGRYIRTQLDGVSLNDGTMTILTVCYSEAFRGVMERWLQSYEAVPQDVFVEVVAALTEATIQPAIRAMKQVQDKHS